MFRILKVGMIHSDGNFHSGAEAEDAAKRTSEKNNSEVLVQRTCEDDKGNVRWNTVCIVVPERKMVTTTKVIMIREV